MIYDMSFYLLVFGLVWLILVSWFFGLVGSASFIYCIRVGFVRKLHTDASNNINNSLDIGDCILLASYHSSLRGSSKERRRMYMMTSRRVSQSKIMDGHSRSYQQNK